MSIPPTSVPPAGMPAPQPVPVPQAQVAHGQSAETSTGYSAPGAPDAVLKPARKRRLWRFNLRLRTKIIALMISLLGIAMLLTGVSTYVVLEQSMTNQLKTSLNQASQRAQSPGFSDRGGGGYTCQSSEGVHNPLLTPGQQSGLISMCVSSSDEIEFAGQLTDGNTSSKVRELTEADKNILFAYKNGAYDGQTAPADGKEYYIVKLSIGDYLVKAYKGKNPQSDILITGVPMKTTQDYLGLYVTAMVIGSLAVMIGAGALGSVIIRRTMQPLERVSGVALEVAHTDLSRGTLDSAVRVQERDADPDTEVGAVGYALNQMLNNVDSAITIRDRTEQQIRAFIADASHELRTPLASIKGYADMMRWTEALSDEGQSSLMRIDSQTDRMRRLVEDLLLLARLDEGREPKYEMVDLTELLIESISDIQVAARTHKWRLDVPDVPVEMYADKMQMQQVILNLLSNARKHTDDGTTVIAGLRISADGQHALINVVDNGPGIAPEFISKIFDRFSRADKARSGSDGTTGLGLSIVQAIVQAHGGTIEVASRPGRTEFKIRVPLDYRKHM